MGWNRRKLLHLSNTLPHEKDILLTNLSHRPSTWTEIVIHIDPPAREALYAFLYDMGCAGIVCEGEHDEVIRFYLPVDQNVDEFRIKFDLFIRRLGDIFPELASPVVINRSIEKQDWANQWRRFFKPDRISPDLFVFPAWETVPEDIKPHIIRMDPGPAFGTGQHATTRLCLRAMENIPCPSSKSLLDIGTGSGILSIYGALLKIKRIVGIDIDQEALIWAARNIGLNGLDGKIELSAKPVAEWRETFDIVTANLTRDTILDLMSPISRLLDREGYLILSGILRDQEKDIEAGLGVHSLKKERVTVQGDWICIEARKSRKP